MKLVTVTVGTYNSSDFIIETLESISAQSYRDIELIIGDDASTDDTLEKVKGWVAKSENQKRFSNIRVLEVSLNTGPTANANRKLHIASGEWIKFLGADDTLMPDCISDNMKYVNDNPEARVIFSKLNLYRNTFEEKNFIKTTPEGEIKQDSIIWPLREVESQYKMLLTCDRIHFTPSVFLHRETLLSLGGFDERFKMMEDYPLWLNLTMNGYKLYFMNRVTVNYRQHSKAINNTGKSHLIKPNYFRTEEFRKLYTYPKLPFDIRLLQKHNWYVSQLFRFKWFNMNTPQNRFFLRLLTIHLNPFNYLVWVRKKMVKSLKNKEFYM
jgi:alpha-1,3-rhamnosyltransferase